VLYLSQHHLFTIFGVKPYCCQYRLVVNQVRLL